MLRVLGAPSTPAEAGAVETVEITEEVIEDGRIDDCDNSGTDVQRTADVAATTMCLAGLRYGGR